MLLETAMATPPLHVAANDTSVSCAHANSITANDHINSNNNKSHDKDHEAAEDVTRCCLTYYACAPQHCPNIYATQPTTPTLPSVPKLAQ